MKTAHSHHYESISAIESAHRGHFFDADSKRFFRSRIGQDAYLTADRKTGYFTTSEQFVGSDRRAGPRLFTLRSCNMVTGDINTVGEFQGYSSSAQVKRAAIKAANGVADSVTV